MKRSFLVFSLLFVSILFVQAKKIKFAVDMGTYTISTLGIHVMGDFQTIAGFSGGDFNPATTSLTQEGSSTIYSIVLDLPAFQKYEFKYVNGNQTYESEFVPDEARVGYNFDDNRWIYLDSLQNDTTKLGAVMFSGNAPAGKTLIRFMVDLQNVASISPNGVHVAGPFQTNDPSQIRLYSFGGGVYEVIAYITNTAIPQQYKYYNGNTAINSETVPASCASSGYRATNLLGDSILITVCYNECVACIPNSIKKNQIAYQTLKLFPNPSKDLVNIQLNEMNKGDKFTLTDISGKMVMEKVINENCNEIQFDLKNYKSGLYQLYYNNAQGTKHTQLIIE